MTWMLVGAALLAFNTWLGAGKVAERMAESGNALPFAFGQAVALTLIVGVLALLSPRHRNATSLGKVLFWTQVVALVFVLVQ
jgi:hypothetical protein